MESPATQFPRAAAPAPTTAIFCPKGTRFWTLIRTGTVVRDDEDDAEADAAGALAAPWKARAVREGGGERLGGAAAESRDDDGGIEKRATTTAVEGEERFRAAATTASGRGEDETAAATRILTTRI